jgi:transcriptional regulator with XRE-family HTH domain
MIRDATLYKSLGALIRRRRRRLELTQADLAAKLGVSRASLANIETGRQNVLVHQLYDLSDALDLPVQDLLPIRTKKSPVNRDLPLPKGLTAEQRAQITQLLGDTQLTSTSGTRNE